MKHGLFKLFVCFLLIAVEGFAQDCCACLDFETAWLRVISCAPSVAAAELEVDARLANSVQARLLQNPVLEVEGENLGVSHRSRNTEPPQTTVSLSQF